MPATPHPDPTRLAAACDTVFTRDAPALVGLTRGTDPWILEDGPAFALPEDLIGFSAPSHWDGLAVVTTGTARHLEAAHPPLRARITYALDRAGRTASSITTIEGTTRLSSERDGPIGHLADVCHRVLGLPAEPEPSSPMTLLAASWLSDVLAAHDELGDGFPLDDWEGGLSLCPFHDGAADRPTWLDVHRAMVGDARGWGELSPDDVAWMDAPTLARFMLASRPPLSVLFHELADRSDPSFLGRLLVVLARAGIDPETDIGGSTLRRGRAAR